MSFERPTLENAQDEAAEMRKKLELNQALNYDEAETQVAIERKLASGEAKDVAEAEELLKMDRASERVWVLEQKKPDVADVRSEAEQIKRYLQVRIEYILLEHAKKIGEGHNGVVFKLNLQDVPANVLKELRENGIDLGSERAIKILKVYEPGAGEHEFQMQQQAFEIAEKHKDDPKFAKVPKPYFCMGMNVADETRDHLTRSSEVKLRNDIEMIAMDLIPGEDFSRIISQALIRQFPDDPPEDYRPKPNELPEYTLLPKAQLDLQKTNVLLKEVGILLGFYKGATSKTKRNHPTEQAANVEAAFNANYDRLFRYLQNNSDFRVHPIVIEQIENLVREFHRNGLVWRDGHLRNFMVVGDISAPEDTPADQLPKVYLIDYGNSKVTPNKIDDDDYIADVGSAIVGWDPEAEQKKRYPKDESVADHLKKFARPRNAAVSKLEEMRDSLLGRAVASHDWKGYRKSMETMIQQGEFDPAKAFELTPNVPKKLSALFAFTYDLAAKDPKTAEALKGFLNKAIESLPKDNEDRKNIEEALKTL